MSWLAGFLTTKSPTPEIIGSSRYSAKRATPISDSEHEGPRTACRSGFAFVSSTKYPRVAASGQLPGYVWYTSCMFTPNSSRARILPSSIAGPIFFRSNGQGESAMRRTPTFTSVAAQACPPSINNNTTCRRVMCSLRS